MLACLPLNRSPIPRWNKETQELNSGLKKFQNRRIKTHLNNELGRLPLKAKEVQKAYEASLALKKRLFSKNTTVVILLLVKQLG